MKSLHCVRACQGYNFTFVYTVLLYKHVYCIYYFDYSTLFLCDNQLPFSNIQGRWTPLATCLTWPLQLPLPPQLGAGIQWFFNYTGVFHPRTHGTGISTKRPSVWVSNFRSARSVFGGFFGAQILDPTTEDSGNIPTFTIDLCHSCIGKYTNLPWIRIKECRTADQVVEFQWGHAQHGTTCGTGHGSSWCLTSFLEMMMKYVTDQTSLKFHPFCFFICSIWFHHVSCVLMEHPIQCSRCVHRGQCCYYIMLLNQLMVNRWFGARWFGFLGSPYERYC